MNTVAFSLGHVQHCEELLACKASLALHEQQGVCVGVVDAVTHYMVRLAFGDEVRSRVGDNFVFVNGNGYSGKRAK